MKISNGRFYFAAPRVWRPGLMDIYGIRKHKTNQLSVPATPWSIYKVAQFMEWNREQMSQDVFDTVRAVEISMGAHIYKDLKEPALSDAFDQVFDTSDRDIPWWEHQKRTLLFAFSILANSPIGGGAGLWLDMGTGKSRVAIELIKSLLDQEERSVLILCPKNAVHNTWTKNGGQLDQWDEESLKVSLDGSAKVVDKAKWIERFRAYPPEASGAKYLVCHYDIAWRVPILEQLAQTKFDAVILDEIHRIKTPGSNISKAMAQLAPLWPIRIGLSGTPLANNPLDAYGIYRFLDSGIFQRNNQDFKNEYAIFGGFEDRQVVGWKNQEDMKDKFFSIAIRIKAEDAQELPPVQHFPVIVPNENKRLYYQMEKAFKADIDSGQIQASNGAARVQKLQQITSGFLYNDQGEGKPLPKNPKIKALFELLEDIGNEPVIIWYYFRYERDMLRDAFKKAGMSLKYCDPVLNDNTIDSWTNGSDQYLLAQIDRMSESIDLTRARHAIYYSHGVKLYKYEQSLKRNHRGNQTRKCIYYHLLMNCTVDERAYKALQNKKEIVEGVMNDYSNDLDVKVIPTKMSTKERMAHHREEAQSGNI